MKTTIAGKNIKGLQIFEILCTILVIVISLIAAPLCFAILFDIIPVTLLYVQLKLNSISFEGNYFIIENLFRKEKFKKDQCIGLSTISKNPFYTLSLQFQGNKSFRFNIGTYKTYWEVFPIRGKTSADEIFDKIQAFIDSKSE